MTKITTQEINKIAALARIEVSDSQKEHLTTQLTNIISWVETLNEVNTDNIEPLYNVHNMTLTLHDDKVEEKNLSEEVLKNAKNAKYNYYTVPKVIE